MLVGGGSATSLAAWGGSPGSFPAASARLGYATVVPASIHVGSFGAASGGGGGAAAETPTITVGPTGLSNGVTIFMLFRVSDHSTREPVITATSSTNPLAPLSTSAPSKNWYVSPKSYTFTPLKSSDSPLCTINSKSTVPHIFAWDPPAVANVAW